MLFSIFLHAVPFLSLLSSAIAHIHIALLAMDIHVAPSTTICDAAIIALGRS